MSILDFDNVQNVSNDFIYFCDKFGILRDARVNLCGKIENFEFKIQTIVRKEEKKYLKVNFNAVSDMVTSVADNLVRISGLSGETQQHFEKKFLLIEGLSYLLSQHFIVDGIVDSRQINLGCAWNSWYQSIEAPEGISLEEEALSQEEVANFWLTFGALSKKDRGRFRSSLHLYWQARTSFAKGYINAAITNGVAALENLYTLPDEQGYVGYPDMRILTDHACIDRRGILKKEKAYGSIFTKNRNDSDANGIISELNPYDRRSKYLHGGAIKVDNPQNHSQVVDFLTITKKHMSEIFSILHASH